MGVEMNGVEADAQARHRHTGSVGARRFNRIN
jgi:hypothetical protein